MKKIIIVFLVAFLSVFCLNAFTDDEFYEVYDQLVVSNEVIKKQVVEIDKLNEQIDKLIAENTELTEKLILASQELDNCGKLLSKSEKELEDSNKIINNLLNQNWILNLGLNYDLSSLKIGVTVGRRVFLTTFLFGSVYANNKNLELSIAYGILF